MKEVLIRYLCCVNCNGEFTVEKKRVSKKTNEETAIISGLLVCRRCGKKYPIINGIPRIIEMLNPDEERALFNMQQTASIEFIEEKESILDDEERYKEIERLVRKKKIVPPGSSGAYNKRFEMNIEYVVRGIESQKRYVQILSRFICGGVDSILDVGGGQGGMLKILNNAFTPRIAVLLDIDLDWVEVAKIRIPNVEIVRGDACRMPFRDKSFSLIVSQASLEHIEAYDKALDEIGRTANDVVLVSYNPNKYFGYDLGHTNAPITLLPKNLQLPVARLWHSLLKSNLPKEFLEKEHSRVHYIPTTAVRRRLRKFGKVHNVLWDFWKYTARGKVIWGTGFLPRIKRFLGKHLWILKPICIIFRLLGVEPTPCYVLLTQGARFSSK